MKHSNFTYARPICGPIVDVSLKSTDCDAKVFWTASRRVSLIVIL